MNKRRHRKRIWEHWGAWLGAVISIILISVLRVAVDFPLDNIPLLWLEVIYNSVGAGIGFVIGWLVHMLVRWAR